jgi:biotin transport system substrate-specific component
VKTEKPMTKYILTIVFSSLLCAGSFIIIPLPMGIPVTIQDMIVLLNGILLGAICGGLSVLIFLLIGSIGLPVFTGKGGIQIILNSPTGGILIGYFFGAFIVGFITQLFLNAKNKNNFYQYFILTLSTLIGFFIIFIFGIFGFMHTTGASFIKSIYVILIPFIPVTIIKSILIILLSKKFYSVIKNYLY